MAANHDEKTEPATPRRRQQARDKGQVARSQDLSAAIILLASFVGLYLLGPRLWEGMYAVLRASLASDAPADLEGLLPFASLVFVEMVKRLAPFLLILFVAMLAVLYAQVGSLLTFEPLVPNLSKISPLAGFRRLFSVRSLMQAVSSFGKLLVVGFVAYLMVLGSAAAIFYASALSFYDTFRLGTSLMFDLGMRLSVALLVLALLDFAWQRYQHERDLRMTKEEVKDEFRSMEGDPKVKSRRREVQLQLALQRVRKDVPTADVVVTNPTHYAVAIRYDANSMIAPRVVAKGVDYLALRIRQVAAEFGIPIVERRALARGLYESVEVGEYVPEEFYRAVAEILAYIYELTGKSLPQRRGDLAGVGQA